MFDVFIFNCMYGCVLITNIFCDCIHKVTFDNIMNSLWSISDTSVIFSDMSRYSQIQSRFTKLMYFSYSLRYNICTFGYPFVPLNMTAYGRIWEVNLLELLFPRNSWLSYRNRTCTRVCCFSIEFWMHLSRVLLNFSTACNL